MHKFYGKGGEELVIMAKTTLTVSADGKAVNVPVLVQPNSSHPCVLGTNVLPHLGIAVCRANGQPLTLKHPLGYEWTSQVRLVEASVIPGRRVKFLEARLDFHFSPSWAHIDCPLPMRS